MIRPPQHPPARYELRVQGHLDASWSAWFGGLTLTQDADGTTTLCGVMADQAELHGLLARVRDVGATLLSVTAVEGVPGPEDAQPAQGPSSARPRPASPRGRRP